ncbi:hypothetical protein [Aliivibrio wodanis]|uniref:hypothetical protein n=1 Tax=Aliivibrio wodanis TaxID=80852 RepID=UPI00406C723C
MQYCPYCDSPEPFGKKTLATYGLPLCEITFVAGFVFLFLSDVGQRYLLNYFS